MTPSDPPIPPSTFDRRTRALLFVLCGAAFLDSLDISMVTIALPSIGSDLDLSTVSLQWVLGGYALGYGGFLLLGGRTTDLLGRRRTFLVALGVMAAASLFGATAPAAAWLIVARFVTGVSAAFTIPAGLSIITTTFPEGAIRHRAVALYTATAASGFSFGLVIGGALTSIHWRLTFAVPIPVAVALLLAGRRLLTPSTATGRGRGRYDVAGAVTITTAVIVLIFAITRAPDAGWATASTVTLVVASTILAALFVVIEARTPHPLMRLGLLRSTRLVVANLVMAAIGCFVAFQFLATLYLQDVLGWSAMPTALAFLPGGLLIAVATPRIGLLITRIGPLRTQLIGMAAFTGGYLLFARIDTDFTYASMMLPTMVLLGIGFSSAYPATTVAATDDVTDDEQGIAAGLLNTSFQLGGALTLAASAAIVAAGLGPATNDQALLDAIRPALVTIAGISGLGLTLTLAAASAAFRHRAPRT